MLKRRRSFFFRYLNEWLHESLPHDSIRPKTRKSNQYAYVLEFTPFKHRSAQERLHIFNVCLRCAQEACAGHADSFPDELKLPKTITLNHVSAADLTMLSAAIKKSSTIEVLQLQLDKVQSATDLAMPSAAVEESWTFEMDLDLENKKYDSGDPSRIQRQTRKAMTSFAAAVGRNTSLRTLEVDGPTYSMMEKHALASLVSRSNRLKWLRVNGCGIGDAEVSELASELRQNTQLYWLDLQHNMIGDAGACALADALTHNTTLYSLILSGNSFGEDSRSYLRQQLRHINNVIV